MPDTVVYILSQTWISFDIQDLTYTPAPLSSEWEYPRIKNRIQWESEMKAIVTVGM